MVTVYKAVGKDLVGKWCWVWDFDSKTPVIRKISKYNEKERYPYKTEPDGESFKYARIVVISHIANMIRDNKEPSSNGDIYTGKWCWVWNSIREKERIRKIKEYKPRVVYPFIADGDKISYSYAKIVTNGQLKEMIKDNFGE